jgi:prophage regulatory protein
MHPKAVSCSPLPTGCIAMRLLDLKGLREKGIKFSRMHISRLVRQKKFPRPVKIGANTNAWPETDIDQYIKDCIAARDARP